MVSKQLFKYWRYTAYPRPGVAKAGPARTFGKKTFLKDPYEKNTYICKFLKMRQEAWFGYFLAHQVYFSQDDCAPMVSEPNFGSFEKKVGRPCPRFLPT